MDNRSRSLKWSWRLGFFLLFLFFFGFFRHLTWSYIWLSIKQVHFDFKGQRIKFLPQNSAHSPIIHKDKSSQQITTGSALTTAFRRSSIMLTLVVAEINPTMAERVIPKSIQQRAVESVSRYWSFWTSNRTSSTPSNTTLDWFVESPSLSNLSRRTSNPAENRWWAAGNTEKSS